jgi:tripartite-type tricarboxylate transporter receptor subunit TctC
MKTAGFAALGALFVANCVAAADPAAGYPAKPIRFIVGFTPGGTSDVVARLLAVKLAETWPQPLVVDNRPGAGGNLANEIVARSAADGYTLLCASSSFSIIELQPKQRFCAGDAREFRAVPDGAVSGSARAIGEGIDCARESTTGQIELRIGRQRQHAASRRRAVQEPCGR